jgi:hypothetical protein
VQCGTNLKTGEKLGATKVEAPKKGLFSWFKRGGKTEAPKEAEKPKTESEPKSEPEPAAKVEPKPESEAKSESAAKSGLLSRLKFGKKK